jgi:hypothetical protein
MSDLETIESSEDCLDNYELMYVLQKFANGQNKLLQARYKPKGEVSIDQKT